MTLSSEYQTIYYCCSSLYSDSLLEFNCKKSVCTSIGPSSTFSIDNLTLGREDIGWTSSFKYLGVAFNTGRKLPVDINVTKCKFFASCNCILGNVKCLNDVVKLNLIEPYCLPILLFATVAMPLSQEQLAKLNAGWNSGYRRIFGFNKWESVRSFIAGLGRLDFISLRAYLCIRFCK